MTNAQSGTEQEGSLAWVIFLSFVAAIGGFLFGFDSGVINGTVDALQKAFGSSSVGTGINVSSMLLGCAAGAFFAGTPAGWFANFLVTMTFPILLATFDLGITYMIYAAFGLVAWFFVRGFVEETKGKTLEEMSR